MTATLIIPLGLNESEFFKLLEERGGWPLGDDKRYLSYYHSGERETEWRFGSAYVRTEWWTTIYSRDDYLWWKLSPERKAAEAEKVRRAFVAQIARFA